MRLRTIAAAALTAGLAAAAVLPAAPALAAAAPWETSVSASICGAATHQWTLTWKIANNHPGCGLPIVIQRVATPTLVAFEGTPAAGATAIGTQVLPSGAGEAFLELIVVWYQQQESESFRPQTSWTAPHAC